MKKNKYIPYKYRIHYLLHQLSVHDYEIALKFLPSKCGVKDETFKKWIYIRANEGRSIPAEAIHIMSVFFEVQPFELFENIDSAEELKTEFLTFKNEQFPGHVYSTKFQQH